MQDRVRQVITMECIAPATGGKVSRHYYSRRIGGEGFCWLNTLVVRRCDKHDWWLIERRVADVDQILVCSFGSTPIVTTSYASAMRLAMHCNVDSPPHGLRWIKQAPDDCEGAIEFAYEREVNETCGANSTQLDSPSALGRACNAPYYDVSRLTR